MHRLGRLMGTDADFLFRGTFWLSVGSVIGMGIAFLLSIVYARFLLKETYGEYRYVLSLLSSFGILTFPGIGTAMTRAISRGSLGTYTIANRIIFLLSFSVTALSLLASAWYAFHHQPITALGLLCGGLLIPFVEGLGNWRGFLDGLGRFKEKSLAVGLIKISYGLAMAGVVLLVAREELTALTAVILLVGTYYGIHGIGNIIASLYARSLVPKDATSDPEALRYGAHLSAAGMLGTIATYADSIIIYNLLGAESLAIYAFAIAPPEQLKALLENTAQVSFTKLASSTATAGALTEDAIRSLLSKKVFRAVALSLGVVLLYILFAPVLYPILFPKYTSSILLSQLFALSLIFFPFSAYHGALDVLGNLRFIYAVRIVSPAIQLVLVISFAMFYGLIGVVIARILGRTIHLLLPYTLLRITSLHRAA